MYLQTQSSAANEFTLQPVVGGKLVFTTTQNAGRFDGADLHEAPIEFSIMLEYVKCLWRAGRVEEAVSSVKPLLAYAEANNALPVIADDELSAFVAHLNTHANLGAEVEHLYASSVAGVRPLQLAA